MPRFDTASWLKIALFLTWIAVMIAWYSAPLWLGPADPPILP